MIGIHLSTIFLSLINSREDEKHRLITSNNILGNMAEVDHRRITTTTTTTNNNNNSNNNISCTPGSQKGLEYLIRSNNNT